MYWGPVTVLQNAPVIGGCVSWGCCDMMEFTCTKFVIFIDTKLEMSSIITNCAT